MRSDVLQAIRDPSESLFLCQKSLTSPVRRTEKPKISYYEKAFEADELNKRRSELQVNFDKVLLISIN